MNFRVSIIAPMIAWKDDHLLIVLLLYGFDLEGASSWLIRPSRPTWGLTTKRVVLDPRRHSAPAAGDELKSSFVPFIAISLAVIVTPGPDTAVTIRNTLFGGRTCGVFTALGIASGQTIWVFSQPVSGSSPC